MSEKNKIIKRLERHVTRCNERNNHIACFEIHDIKLTQNKIIKYVSHSIEECDTDEKKKKLCTNICNDLLASTSDGAKMLMRICLMRHIEECECTGSVSHFESVENCPPIITESIMEETDLIKNYLKDNTLNNIEKGLSRCESFHSVYSPISQKFMIKRIKKLVAHEDGDYAEAWKTFIKLYNTGGGIRCNDIEIANNIIEIAGYGLDSKEGRFIVTHMLRQAINILRKHTNANVEILKESKELLTFLYKENNDFRAEISSMHENPVSVSANITMLKRIEKVENIDDYLHWPFRELYKNVLNHDTDKRVAMSQLQIILDIAETREMHKNKRVNDVDQATLNQYLDNLRKKLNELIVGQDYAKQRIVQREKIRISNPNANIYVQPLAFVGKPGVGKTHLARSLDNMSISTEHSMRKLVDLRLVGSSNSIALKGSFPVWVSSTEGHIARALRSNVASDIVFFCDEADKLECDELISLLLTLTDGSKTFRDDFIGIDLDISGSTFIFAMNDETTLNKYLRDRLEIVRFHEQTLEHRQEIARRESNNALKAYNIDEQISFDNNAILYLSSAYTNNTGSRQMIVDIKRVIEWEFEHIKKDQRIQIGKEKIKEILSISQDPYNIVEVKSGIHGLGFFVSIKMTDIDIDMVKSNRGVHSQSFSIGNRTWVIKVQYSNGIYLNIIDGHQMKAYSIVYIVGHVIENYSDKHVWQENEEIYFPWSTLFEGQNLFPIESTTSLYINIRLLENEERGQARIDEYDGDGFLATLSFENDKSDIEFFAISRKWKVTASNDDMSLYCIYGENIIASNHIFSLTGFENESNICRNPLLVTVTECIKFSYSSLKYGNLTTDKTKTIAKYSCFIGINIPD